MVVVQVKTGNNCCYYTHCAGDDETDTGFGVDHNHRNHRSQGSAAAAAAIAAAAGKLAATGVKSMGVAASVEAHPGTGGRRT